MNTKPHPFLVFLLLFLSISLCIAQGVKREIIWSDYPDPISESYAERLKFGHIIVPETRDSINNRQLKIAFCVLEGSNKEGIKNPIIMLPGGPGFGMIGATPYIFDSPNYEERFKNHDVVLFDPRGCGQSEPDLCPEMDLPINEYRYLLGMSQKEMDDEYMVVLEKCLDSLALKKVDLNAYGSDEVAQDIEDLRVSLGVAQWNIMGGSYGTRYGQAVIRNFPESVRSAVFGGLVPTVKSFSDDNLKSFSRSLQLVIDKCNNDPDCKSVFGDLEKKLFEGLNYYNEHPLIVGPDQQNVLQGREAVVTGDLIASGLFTLLYDQNGIEIVPQLIQAVSDKKNWVIAGFVNSLGMTFGDSESDMALFIRLNDNPNYRGPTSINDYEGFTKKLAPFFYFPKMMTETEIAKLSGIEIDTLQDIPIKSNVPTLLNTGNLDPITPPDNATITSTYLTNSVVMNFPGYGHGVNNHKGFSEMITAFYKNPVLPVNIEDCIAETAPLKLISGISYNKGISQVGAKFIMGKELEVYILLGIGAILILIGFFTYPILVLIRKLKKRESIFTLNNYWFPWILNALLVLFFVLLYFGLMASMDRNSYILGFGMLSSYDWIFWIMALVLLLLIRSLWLRKHLFQKEQGKGLILLHAISFLGTIYMSILLMAWGFLWPLSN